MHRHRRHLLYLSILSAIALLLSLSVSTLAAEKSKNLPKAKDWTQFWKRFQKAVVHQDFSTIEKHSALAGYFKEEYDQATREKKGLFFEQAIRECFKKTKPKFTGLDDNVVTCGSQGFIFKWIDGNFKFVETISTE